jgi:cell division transport system permease protein
MPLVPSDSIAGRALVTVIAIMTFLAALTAGIAILIADASSDWQNDVSREMTIQVRPMPGGDLDATTRQAAALAAARPGIASVDPYSKAESEKLLQPWLGAGLDLGDLPVPRLIVVKLDPDRRVDLAELRKALDQVPGASLDDHRVWLARLATMAHATVAIGLVIFALVLTAMLLAVAFATRGAMAGNKEIIEILHFVGAADSFISRQFQRHFFRLGLRGGAIGGGVAILFFLVGGRAMSLWRASAGGEQVEALFGGFGLGLWGYAAILVIAAGIALLTGIVSRTIVYRHLRQLV